MAGKSIPDEKFGAKKAKKFLSGKSKMLFGFLEAAYFFNYLKIGTNNNEVSTFWLDFIEKRERQLHSFHEEMGMCHVFKANLLSQLGRYEEAVIVAKIALERFSGPDVEPQIAPCAMFELGNALRLLGK